MKNSSTLALFVFFTLVAGVSVAQAQGYIPLTPLPGTTEAGASTVSVSSYVGGVIKLSIALGAALAVLFAVIGGTQYVAASINPAAKQNALEKVWNALIGLTIILSSYLVLNSINPDLVNIKLELPPVAVRNWMYTQNQGQPGATGSGCPSITDPAVLLNTAESQNMEGGATVIWTSSDPVVQQNLDKLKEASVHLIRSLAQDGITARVTSAYRPYEYQKHLYEIYKAWIVDGLRNNSDHDCAESRSKVSTEYTRHGLGSKVSNPDTGNSPHIHGTGVDIKVTGIPYDDFRSLGNYHYADINAYMTHEGIGLRWQAITGDEVHFNLK